MDPYKEQLDFREAYHLTWEAGTIALSQNGVRPVVRAIIAEEITNIFDHLDELKAEAEIIAPTLPPGVYLRVTVGTLLSRIDDGIDYIYRWESAIRDEPVNPFAINDDRLTALTNLGMYIRAAKQASQ